MTNRSPAPQNDDELYQLSKEQLVKIIKTLEEKIARLEESLNLDSKTSSKPPSADLLRKSEKKKIQPDANKDSTRRKPGGQPGHEGKTRKGFGRFDRIEVLRPQVCSMCGAKQFSLNRVNVEVQQVAQLVANPIEIVEYHRHHCECMHCGTSCAADWLDEIIPGQDMSVRLQAFIGWLGNYGHMPYTKIRELIFELGHIDIGEGTLVATNERVAQAIELPVEVLGKWLKNEQPNVHVDETPWPVKGIKEWLWVVANQTFCLFHAADTRSRTELEQLLGTEYRGVLCSDDFSVYNGYNAAAQQKCLAHMRRHFLRLSQHPGRDNASIANAFIDLIDDAFDNYRQFQVSNDVAQYNDWATRFKYSLSNELKTWIPKASATALNLLSKLRDKYEQWWYFLDHPQVPPDNNLAERSLRLAVTKRKVSGGSRSLTRFEDTASLLTVVQTCRSQERSVIDFFASALRAHIGDRNSYPSLIPFSAT
jgi:transposase